MTPKNFKKGMLILREAFPERFAEMDKTGMKIWFQLLNDLEDTDWETVILFICRNHQKPPVPATIREISNQKSLALSPEEAWGIVWEGVRQGQWHYDDPVIQKAYDAIGYTTWRNATYSQAPALRAHFYRTFEAMQKRVDTANEFLAIEQARKALLPE